MVSHAYGDDQTATPGNVSLTYLQFTSHLLKPCRSCHLLAPHAMQCNVLGFFLGWGVLTGLYLAVTLNRALPISIPGPKVPSRCRGAGQTRKSGNVRPQSRVPG